MGVAAAALGWTAAEFWASTPHEYWAGFEAWKMMNCSDEES